MRLSWRKLLGLTVQTESGEKLGRIIDVIMDTEGQFVVQYECRSLTKKNLFSRDQVVRFEKGKMVVKDAVIATETESRRKETEVNLGPALMMREK
ncbi:MAG TPA: PRC-barrel domain-containing protein [Patescibacteria group bacterium]|nr:PRC-barrel domain-containing protein [Patescibacteria group bacterium]